MGRPKKKIKFGNLAGAAHSFGAAIEKRYSGNFLEWKGSVPGLVVGARLREITLMAKEGTNT